MKTQKRLLEAMEESGCGPEEIVRLLTSEDFGLLCERYGVERP